MTTHPAMPEHTIGKHDHPEPHTMCWSDLELAAIKRYAESYALATLQAQPAEVSDAEVERIAIESEMVFRSGGKLLTPFLEHIDLTRNVRAFARAILALRPQAVPMTEGWQEVAACPDGDVWFSLSCGHVVMGWKQGPLLLDWEAAVDHDCCSDASAIKAMPVTPPAHHGITAPAGGDVQSDR